MRDTLHWVIWGLGVLAVGLGGYLAGYLKKKGESRAVKEDLHNLVEQVTAVTKTTKEIEAKISNDVWQRQRQWETRKEILFEGLRSLGRARWLLSDSIAAVERIKSAETPDEEQKPRAELLQLMDQSAAMLKTLQEARMLVSLVSGTHALTPFCRAHEVFAEGAVFAHDGDIGGVEKKREELINASVQVNIAIRKELNLE